MEDMNKILHLTEAFPLQLEEMTEEYLLKLRVILWGQAAVAATNKEKLKDLPAASPQQLKKRVKHLSSLNEDKETEVESQEVEKSSQKDVHCNTVAINDSKDKNNTAIESEGGPVAAPRLKAAGSSNDSETKQNINQDILRKSKHLMPPPPMPADETLNKRPQRAAKIKTEKCLKEPRLNTKLRRPTEEIKIKLEHEQRLSQLNGAAINANTPKDITEAVVKKNSLSSEKSDDSVSIIPGKNPSIISIQSDIEDSTKDPVADDKAAKESKKSVESRESGIREIRIKIKREKLSLCSKNSQDTGPANESAAKVAEALPLSVLMSQTEAATVLEETSLASSSSNANAANTAPAKKTRKKKDVVHKPIKVERFSDLDRKLSPVASRTRHGSLNKSDNAISQNDQSKRPESIYEDAVTAPQSHHSGVPNETVDLGPSNDATMNLGPVPTDATFCTNPAQTTYQVGTAQSTFVMDANPNTTVTVSKVSGNGVADATFDVHQSPKTAKNKVDNGNGQRSFETAKDSSIVENSDSLLTEDEQEKPIELKAKPSSASLKVKGVTKTSGKSAAYKMPTRPHELFNPLFQSPVKMRVEAFENAAAAAATEHSKRFLRSKKENATPTSVTTPVIGKLVAPTLGRFLTPTQSSNITNVNSVLGKKGTSASKVLPMPKSANASSLYRSNSAASTKMLHRENSGDDFRKGLHNLAEERKRQREQKHLLAAQQREAKERERAERMAKLAKEREEKRLLRKQQEQEQKKRELEEIQRKLRQQQQEDAAKLKAAKEREMLLHMKQQQQQELAKQKMMPPPPKLMSKYTFEMLHEDDSTDDEDKVSYKRPPPPSWSRSHVRGPLMLKQEYTPSAYIDSFFSVQPMTPDLKIIFPNIDARYLKRNSSVLWSTPPRYSELPKY